MVSNINMLYLFIFPINRTNNRYFKKMKCKKSRFVFKENSKNNNMDIDKRYTAI